MDGKGDKATRQDNHLFRQDGNQMFNGMGGNNGGAGGGLGGLGGMLGNILNS